MQHRHRGFTLVEAMIATLVLAAGLLGLGQLQARLTAASTELHGAADAFRVGAGWLEQFRFLSASRPSGIDTRMFQVQEGTGRFSVQPRVTPGTGIHTAEVTVEWTGPGGLRSLHLGTAADTATPAFDQRWLLPGR